MQRKHSTHHLCPHSGFWLKADSLCHGERLSRTGQINTHMRQSPGVLPSLTGQPLKQKPLDISRIPALEAEECNGGVPISIADLLLHRPQPFHSPTRLGRMENTPRNQRQGIKCTLHWSAFPSSPHWDAVWAAEPP